MGRRQAMIDHAIAIANDDSHGYSWADRWSQDRDCSSLMYDSADAAGYSVGRGEDRDRYTGTMIEDFSNAGFTVHDYDSFEEYPGCILLRDPAGKRGHTEMYIGDGLTVGAHIAETGDVYGEPGDQTGEEISIAPNPGDWDYILEPPSDESEDDMALSDNDIDRIQAAILGYHYKWPEHPMALKPNSEDIDVYQMIWNASQNAAEIKELLKQLVAKL